MSSSGDTGRAPEPSRSLDVASLKDRRAALAETVCADVDGQDGTARSETSRAVHEAAFARGFSSGDDAPVGPRYRIGPMIGQGGMAAIYQGWDCQLDREVALKVIAEKYAGNSVVVRRFLDEARITGSLQHPGVVAIHEVGRLPDRRPFFVMSRIHGETLEEILARRECANDDWGRLLYIFDKLCDAVAYAHAKGVIHRDLKPANIMVGAFGVVSVMDWGLAKVLGEPEVPELPPSNEEQGMRGPGDGETDPQSAGRSASDTQAGTFVGTPAYIAPEQARGEIDRVQTQADVFGLGSILCEILTGQPPYTGSSFKKIYAKARGGDLANALARLDASDAAPDMINLAKRCLAPEPADRPPSAVEVARATAAYLHSEERRAERDLVRFFDISLDLFCIANRAGYFVRINENFSRVLGYTSIELTSRPFMDFVHPDDRQRTTAEVERLNRGEPCIQFTNRYRHIFGYYLWFEWNALSDPEEGVIYAVARDVTDRVAHREAFKRHEEALARSEGTSRLMAAVLESSGDAIICQDRGGIIRSWNKGAEQLFGYPATEVLGYSIALLLPTDRQDEEQSLCNRLDRGERVEPFNTTRLRKGGQPIDVSLAVSPVLDPAGQLIGVFRMARAVRPSETPAERPGTAE